MTTLFIHAHGRLMIAVRGEYGYFLTMITPLKTFFASDSASGVLLILAAVAALVIDNNTALGPVYDDILHAKIGFGVGPIDFTKSIHHWINDGLMAIFFFVVGLEIKREFLQGQLSEPKKTLLPILAAIGGVIFPALIYVALNYSDPSTMRGWAIPMATDIAFAVGIACPGWQTCPAGAQNPATVSGDYR